MHTKAKIFAVAMTLMLGALALSAVFTLVTFDRTYRDELLTGYYLPVVHLEANLSRAVGLGVPLDAARGLERDFAQAWNTLAERGASRRAADRGLREPALLLLRPDGEVLRHVGGSVDVRSEEFRGALSTPNGRGESAAGTRFVEGPTAFLIPIRILDAQDNWAASLVAVVDRREVAPTLAGPLRDATRHTLAVLAGSLLIYGLALAVVLWSRSEDEDLRRRRMLWTSVCFGVAAQIAGAVAGAHPYRDPYLSGTADKAAVLTRIVQQDTTAALARGARLEYLDFNQYHWRHLLESVPEVAVLEVRDRNRSAVVRVDHRGVTHFANEKLRGGEAPPKPAGPNADDLKVLAESLSVDGIDRGAVTARVSSAAVRAQVYDLAADALAATMVSLLIFVELLLLFHWSLRQGPRPARLVNGDACAVIRPAAFLFLFGVDLSMSFVPLHMERMYEPLFGLSKDVVMGLPISVEFLFVGLAILAAGVWMDRSGWRPSFITGTAVAALGAVYSWLAPDAMHFVLSRAVLGTGYGLTLMACQGFVVRATDTRSTARGLAQLFAGIYGGSICGGVAGAILAERFGFGPVFAASGIIVFGVLAYVSVFLPRDPAGAAAATPERPPAAAPETPAISGAVRFRRFITNRAMLALILFSSLPASIAAVGFLNYFSPIYLNRIGASQSTIGQVLMLYGVCLVFFGPWVSRSVNSVSSKKLAVVAGCLLGSAALLSFQLLDGVFAAAVAVVGLGLAHSLVLSSQSAYALALRVSRDFGEGKAISVFRSSGRLGQMLGPIAFGSIALAGDGSEGMAWLGYAYLAAAVLFWALTRGDRHMLVEEPAR